MSNSVKKLLSTAMVGLLFTLNACGTPTDLTGVDLNAQQVQAQSLFGNKKGSVPDNGDLNIKIDNLILARRTFNNAPAKFYNDGAEAYPAMERLIDNARNSLYIETFIFHDDATGRRIADKLIAKKKQGVDVKILIDALGLNVKKGDSRIFDYLATAGMDVKKYNKTLVGTTGINITHRKILLADGDIAMTGGMNFGDEYKNVWHDSMTEVQGEVAQDMQEEFFANWVQAGGKIPKNLPKLQPGKIYGEIPMRVVVTSAHESKKRYEIRNSMQAAIDTAKEKITMAGAYFSDDDLVKRLKNAVKRGVKVDIIMPKKGDSKIYNQLNLGTAKDFLKSGVNVFFYEPRFSHIKAAIIDNMTIVGSANPDARSFRENQELNILIEDNAFKQDLSTRLFANDINQSSVENLASVKVGLVKKLAISFYELVDYYL